MAGLKEIRTRLSTVTSTQQLTSAMKMVSAAKLRKSQNKQIRLRAYMQSVGAIFRAVMEAGEEDERLKRFIDGPKEIQRVLIFVFTSNKGLCGNFNSSICKAVDDHIRKNYSTLTPGKDLQLICLGSKGAEYFTRKAYPLYKLPCGEVDIEKMTFDQVYQVASETMGAFYVGKFDRIEVAYHQPINAVSQKLILRPVLPVKGNQTTPPILKSVEGIRPVDYILQPSRLDILRDLFPMLFSVGIYSFLVASQVAEHGARMTAMSKASDNAEELNRVLNRQYNKLRQTSITNELLEIVSGANALS